MTQSLQNLAHEKAFKDAAAALLVDYDRLAKLEAAYDEKKLAKLEAFYSENELVKMDHQQLWSTETVQAVFELVHLRYIQRELFALRGKADGCTNMAEAGEHFRRSKTLAGK